MADTIAAISTAVGGGAVSIVRLSGDNAITIADSLFYCKKTRMRDALPNQLYLGTLKTADIQDKCLCVVFHAPASYTGENVVEFQLHGGFRLAESVLTACVEKGARLADKGEFTKRAFLNGKMSLADAEGVVDMINAESKAQLNSAYKQMTGGLSIAVNQILQEVEYIAAQLEACLDYPEEMEDETLKDADAVLKSAALRVSELINSYAVGKTIKNGLNTAIIGVPNIGKSSLMNALLKRERAIVTSVAGTTRDTLEEKLELDGFCVILTDTAGLRKSDDEVEQLGIERAMLAAKTADVILYVCDASQPLDLKARKDILSDADESIVINVFNKCDLGVYAENKGKGIFISAKTGQGIGELCTAITSKLKTLLADGSAQLVTSARHYEALLTAQACLQDAISGLNCVETECVIIDIKNAYNALGRITGNTADEKIIDAIFDKFCLGK